MGGAWTRERSLLAVLRMLLFDRTDAGVRFAERLEPFFAVGLWYRDFALLERPWSTQSNQQEKACKSRLEELEPSR